MAGERLNLREFVTAALTDVLGGIRDAQEDKTIGRFIAPIGIGTVAFPSDGGVVHAQRLLVTTMKFDIAVTVSSDRTSTGNVKAGISVLGASASGEEKTSSEDVSRIQFAVPIKFPRYGAANGDEEG